MITAQMHLQRGPGDYPAPDWHGYSVRAVLSGSASFPPAPAGIRSILVLKLDALGDHLLHTPFFAGLRQFYPQAKITLLCVKENLNLAETNPHFDHIITLPHAAGSDQRMNLMFAMQLQSHEAAPFDLIILPRWSEDWHHAGVIAQTLDAPYRLSYSARSTPLKQKHALHHDSYFTHVIDDERPAHEVWRGMQLLHALGMKIPTDIHTSFYLTDADHAKIDAMLDGKDYPRPWFALGVGASLDHKRWPAEKFATLADHLQIQYGGTIFLIGNGSKDEAAAAAISRNRKDCVNCTQNLMPRETGALISRCDMMVTNDSFALHAAAAVRVPAVEIIGHPVDGNPDSEYLPRRFGPWGIPFAWVQPVSCDGCESPIRDYLNETKCTGDVPVEAVLNAVKELLACQEKTSP